MGRKWQASQWVLFNKKEVRDVYTICVKLNMSNDSFSVIDDCGNKGSRDGILLSFIKEEIK